MYKNRERNNPPLRSIWRNWLRNLETKLINDYFLLMFRIYVIYRTISWNYYFKSFSFPKYKGRSKDPNPVPAKTTFEKTSPLRIYRN